jgi:hypothetical protein
MNEQNKAVIKEFLFQIPAKIELLDNESLDNLETELKTIMSTLSEADYHISNFLQAAIVLIKEAKKEG